MNCHSAGRELRICGASHIEHPHSRIERRFGSHWKVVAGPLANDFSAEWFSAFLSPDKKTILAEWDYPCDTHVALFIPSTGGKPRVVSGEASFRKAPGDEQAVGWTRDGKAKVRTNAGMRYFDPAKVLHRGGQSNSC